MHTPQGHPSGRVPRGTRTASGHVAAAQPRVLDALKCMRRGLHTVHACGREPTRQAAALPNAALIGCQLRDGAHVGVVIYRPGWNGRTSRKSDALLCLIDGAMPSKSFVTSGGGGSASQHEFADARRAHSRHVRDGAAAWHAALECTPLWNTRGGQAKRLGEYCGRSRLCKVTSGVPNRCIVSARHTAESRQGLAKGAQAPAGRCFEIADEPGGALCGSYGTR